MGRGNSVTLRNKINGISSLYNPDMMLVGKMSMVNKVIFSFSDKQIWPKKC